MPCSKCGKKVVRPTRAVYLPSSLSDDGRVENSSLYSVQSRMHTAISTADGGKFRFLPGEKVELTGTFLYRSLTEDSDLFIFLRAAERSLFLENYPDLRGAV